MEHKFRRKKKENIPSPAGKLTSLTQDP